MKKTSKLAIILWLWGMVGIGIGGQAHNLVVSTGGLLLSTSVGLTVYLKARKERPKQ